MTYKTIPSVRIICHKIYSHIFPPYMRCSLKGTVIVHTRGHLRQDFVEEILSKVP